MFVFNPKLLRQTNRTAEQGRPNIHSLPHVFVRIKGLQEVVCHMQYVNMHNHSHTSHFCGISATFLSTVSKKTALLLYFTFVTTVEVCHWLLKRRQVWERSSRNTQMPAIAHPARAPPASCVRNCFAGLFDGHKRSGFWFQCPTDLELRLFPCRFRKLGYFLVDKAGVFFQLWSVIVV